jgi:hypothetical protein
MKLILALLLLTFTTFAQTLDISVDMKTTTYSYSNQYDLTSDGYYTLSKVKADGEMSTKINLSGVINGNEIDNDIEDGHERTKGESYNNVYDKRAYTKIKLIKEGNKYFVIEAQLDIDGGIFASKRGNRYEPFTTKVQVKFVDGNYKDYLDQQRVTVITTKKGLKNLKKQIEKNFYSITQKIFKHQFDQEGISVTGYEILESEFSYESHISYIFDSRRAAAANQSSPAFIVNYKAKMKGSF